MKKQLAYSTILATLLSLSALQADALHDSVSKEASKALHNPTGIKGEASAKAKVEETRSKEAFAAKQNIASFHQEALQDEAKKIENNVGKLAPKEVMEGLNDTMVAIEALSKNDTQKAEKYLEKATSLFDTALKNNPKLGLLPVANETIIHAFDGDVDIIKKAVKTARERLKENDVQTARAILLPLQDDMIVTTEYIPMDLYPVATKKAAQALKKGNKKESLALLMQGLSTMVEDTVVVPLPLLMAQDFIMTASQLDKSKKKEVTVLLDAAQTELQKALLLGYTKTHSETYSALEKEISTLKDEVKGKNAVEKLYVHLKESFKKLLGETRKDVKRNKSESKVQAYQQKEYVKGHL